MRTEREIRDEAVAVAKRVQEQLGTLDGMIAIGELRRLHDELVQRKLLEQQRGALDDLLGPKPPPSPRLANAQFDPNGPFAEWLAKD